MSDSLIDLRLGDCIEVMRSLEDESVSALVTDPPYGINFMGKAWDGRAIEEALANPRDVSSFQRLTGGADGGPRKLTTRTASAYQTKAGEAGSYDFTPKGMRAFQEWTEAWSREALRVLKPGAHIVVFGGTRTYHRMVCGIEDAGFEIRDQLAWMFGSGFPKSLDVAKAIDSKLGAEGEWKQEDHAGRPGARTRDTSIIGQTNHATDENPDGLRHVYEPTTDEAKEWKGWGTALKPAYEPIVLARKPFVGTVAGNVLTHSTGALNVDETRIGTEERYNPPAGNKPGGASLMMSEKGMPEDAEGTTAEGRWPANVILDEDAAAILDGQSGELTSGTAVGGLHRRSNKTSNCYGHFKGERNEGDVTYGDSGGASRFFYVPKVSRAERNAGLEPSLFNPYTFEPRPLYWSSGEQSPGTFQSEETEREARNFHPTVKPIELMRWLIKLITPPSGIVLDPFMGSGSTGCAAALENFGFIGIERETDYMRIAEARIAHWAVRFVDSVKAQVPS